jgi:hypothetical protein
LRSETYVVSAAQQLPAPARASVPAKASRLDVVVTLTAVAAEESRLEVLTLASLEAEDRQPEMSDVLANRTGIAGNREVVMVMLVLGDGAPVHLSSSRSLKPENSDHH